MSTVRLRKKSSKKAPAIKKKSKAAVPPPPPVPSIPTEIPGLPRSEGPPSIPQGKGVDYLSERGAVSIVLDHGALLWLWELAESKGLSQYVRYDAVPTLKPVSDAGARAIKSLRAGGVDAGLVSPPETVKAKSKIKVKKTGPSVSGPTIKTKRILKIKKK